LLGQLKTIKRG